MKQLALLAVAAMVAGAVPGARASTSSEIRVSDFRVSVSSISPGHGQPGVSFDGAGGSTSECASSSGGTRPDQHVTAASGRAFGDALTATQPDPFASGSAAFVGDVFGSGAVAQVSTFASSLVPASQGEGTIGLVNDVGAAYFTLAPYTQMTISAYVVATASTSGASFDEFAESGLLMAIGDHDGLGPQRNYVDFNVFAPGFVGPYSDTESLAITLNYVNDTDAAISGLFSGYISSLSVSGDPPPVSDVPEPGGATMMVSALLAAAALRRGRRPVREPRRQ